MNTHGLSAPRTKCSCINNYNGTITLKQKRNKGRHERKKVFLLYGGCHCFFVQPLKGATVDSCDMCIPSYGVKLKIFDRHPPSLAFELFVGGGASTL